MTMVSIIFIFLSPQIISFFTDQNDVQKIGISALQIIGSGFIFYGIGMVMIQSLNGAGDTRTPTWINFVGFWLFQIPLAYYFVTFTDWGLNALFAAIPIAETSIAVMAFIIFRQGKWKKVKV